MLYKMPSIIVESTTLSPIFNLFLSIPFMISLTGNHLRGRAKIYSEFLSHVLIFTITCSVVDSDGSTASTKSGCFCGRPRLFLGGAVAEAVDKFRAFLDGAIVTG